MSTEINTTDIAIVGMACRVPGASNVDEFWRNLRDGIESVRRYTLEELREAGVSSTLLADPRYVPAGAPLEHMEAFDAEFFGMSAHEAAVMDPQHRHMLECAWEALEHAGHPPRSFRGPIGIFAGSGHNAYLPFNLLSRSDLIESDGFFLLRHTGNDKDFLTTRVSYVFDLHGPSVAVQTACSTSLVAVHLGVQSLLAGECDMALAGGVTIELPHRQGYLYAEGEILSPDGHCRPFDANASGTVFGSGAGVVVLRRLADAIADGDTIHAVVKGTAVNNDGSGKVSYLAPSVPGQASAIAEALAVANIDASTIGYVEAHGTGTLVGDPIEVAALTEAFRQHTQARGYCGIGSVKSNIGHLDTAAGVVSLIKAILAIRQRQLPPSLNFAQANPACRFEETPFVVNAELTEWESETPRRAGVSSLGVGGTNAHVIIEEWVEPNRPVELPAGDELLVLSARTLEALELAGERLVEALEAPDAAPLADIAWTLQVGREPMPFRRIVAAGTREEAVERLRARDPRLVFESRAPDRESSVGFMFAGGGTQHPGMGSELYRTEPVYRAAIDECLSLLEPWHAEQVRSALFPVPGAQAEAARLLEQPSLGLPALFMTQLAQARLWQHWGIEPSALIGHSMGEYTAACVAGVFTLADALALVTTRGRLFETVKQGAMLSIPMPARELEPLLGADLSLAAVNGPSLCVASGTLAAIDRLERLLKARGLDTSRLRISVAAHSALLAPILSEFHAFVRKLELRGPAIPVASNLSGTWLTDAEATDPEYWVRHLRQTVRFADGIRTMVGDGSRVLLEVGPGRTLSTFARQQEAPGGAAPPVALPSMPHRDEATPDGTFMRTTLGRLWIAGVDVPWERVSRGPRKRVALPTYPFAKTRHWIEPGQSAPAPVSQGSVSIERSRDMAQWFSQPSWRREPAPPEAELAGPVLLIGERTRLTKKLVNRLRSQGIDVVHTRRGNEFAEWGRDGYTIPAGNAETFVRLVSALRDRGRLPRQIVYLPGGRADMHAAFFPLLGLAQALGSEELTDISLTVLTAGGARVAGESSLDPVQGALTGAVRVIPAELPGVLARTIDLAPGDASAATIDRLVQELAVASNRPVALRGPDRWVPAFEPWPIPPAPHPGFHEEGAYLITGGFGGIGLAVARHLAEHHHARLTLVGRKALPARNGWDSWIETHAEDDEVSRRIRIVRDLETAGARVLPVTADVSDQRAFRHAVEESRRWFGVLNGVIHAAGVLDDGALQVRDEATVNRVLGPKVQGTIALEHAVRGVHLDFVVLFSSISAFAGLPGQFDYAAANAFMDAWAQERAGSDGAHVVAINWAPWSDVGMAAALAETMGVASPFRGEPTNHPVLSRHVSLNSREQAFVGRLDAGTDWILSEHRVRGGQPMLPGTGFLALAHLSDYLDRRHERHPAADATPTALALRDIEFIDPLIVPEGARTEIRVRRDVAEGRFAVESRADVSEPWRVHARGRIGIATGPEQVIDLALLRSRCVREVSATAVSTEAPHLAFGPRWDNVKHIRVAQREAMLELELAQRFAGDVNVYPLHPALMDMALAGAQALVPWLDREHQMLVPLSVQSVRVWDGLPRQVISRVRYREDLSTPGDVAVFDAAVCDHTGRVLVEATELSLLAVRDTARLAVAPPRAEGRPADRAPANPLLALTIREGIRASEGVEALERILAAGAPPQVAVSPLPLERLLQEFDALRAPAPRPRERGDEAEAAEERTPLEREIGEIAAGLLSMTHVGLDENLIDLGLHSLLAVRLFTRLKKATGRNLPLATLLEAPTVRLLAERFGDGTELRPETETPADILESSNAVRDPRAHRHWLRPLWSHVVPLKPSGTLPPFFSIHARGGAVLNYRTLSTFVDPDQPLYGIQCRGLDGRTEPFRSIEEMADQYLEEIRRIQPHGPYFLGGGSLGGVVGVEIARRLKAQGEPIGLIAMFDSWGPVWFSPDHKPGRGGSRLWQKLNAHMERLRRQGAMSGTQLLLHGVERRIITRTRLLAARVLRKLGIELPHNLRYFYVEHLNLAALQRFSPKPYDGDIVLFRALDDPDADFSDPTMGWKGSVRGRIEVIDAPGTHNSIVHDAVFGELFRQRLRKAQEQMQGEDAAVR